MTALSDNLMRQSQGLSAYQFVVKNGSTVYAGSLVGLERATGHIVPLDDFADRVYLGVCQEKVVGDGSNRALVSLDKFILPKVTVTGSSAMTDIGSLVYATDDGTGLSLTRPADDAVPIGRVLYWHSSTTCDVAMFDMHTSFNMSSQGRGRVFLPAIKIPLNSAAGDVMTGFSLQGHGKIVDWYVISDGDAAGVGANTNLNLEIGGMTVTGGVINATLAAASVQGARINDTAITGNNEYHDGDLLDIVYAVTTAFTAGLVTAYILVEPLP